MLTLTYGTRPEYLKIKPVIKELNKQSIEYQVCKISQHTDLISNTTHTINIHINERATNNRLNNIISSVVNDPILFYRTSYVMVQGDTTSALAVAISAFNNKVPVIHLEAGLRTFDKENPYPEEVNRQLISRIADIHLCPTKTTMLNLKNENITKNVYIVGNTSIDNLVGRETTTTNSILITLHRRENKPIIDKWLLELNYIASYSKNFKFILIEHPSIDRREYNILRHIAVKPPMDHDSLLDILCNCYAVITDSGGIQEEAAYFRKKCIVCRTTTERPEGLNTFAFLCNKPDKFEIIFKFLLNYNIPIGSKCPYGDGTTSKQIIKIFTSKTKVIQ